MVVSGSFKLEYLYLNYHIISFLCKMKCICFKGIIKLILITQFPIYFNKLASGGNHSTWKIPEVTSCNLQKWNSKLGAEGCWAAHCQASTITKDDHVLFWEKERHNCCLFFFFCLWQKKKEWKTFWDRSRKEISNISWRSSLKMKWAQVQSTEGKLRGEREKPFGQCCMRSVPCCCLSFMKKYLDPSLICFPSENILCII